MVRIRGQHKKNNDTVSKPSLDLACRLDLLTFCGIGDITSGTTSSTFINTFTSSSSISCSFFCCSCINTLMIVPMLACLPRAISPLKSPVDAVEVNRFDNEEPEIVLTDEARERLLIEGAGEPAVARRFSTEDGLASGRLDDRLLRVRDSLFEALR